MSLRTAMDRIAVLQATVAITDPITTSVKKAYKLTPRQSLQLPDLPCMMNQASFLREDAIAGLRTRWYRVRMQCAVKQATVEDERAADTALALWERLLDVFNADISLNHTVTLSLFEEGAGEFPSLVTWGDVAYIGFEAVLNLRIDDAFTFS